MNVGGVISDVQVTVRDAVLVLPHPSLAVNVLVVDLIQVPDVASLHVIVGVLHASVAVAVPSAAVISEATGLQLNIGTVA